MFQNECFNPPPPREWSADGADADYLLKMTYGMTVVTQGCAKCGAVRMETTPGRVREVAA
jgi:hypothetical protein